MTAFELPGANDPHPALNEDDGRRDEEGGNHPDWSQIGRIGTVEAGSLEEEIWRELGALPPSRRLNLRS